jgi:hypothetical protein
MRWYRKKVDPSRLPSLDDLEGVFMPPWRQTGALRIALATVPWLMSPPLMLLLWKKETVIRSFNRLPCPQGIAAVVWCFSLLLVYLMLPFPVDAVIP